MKQTFIRSCAGMALVMGALVGMAAHASPAAATQGYDHFTAVGPDKAQANSDESLFYPNDYEAAASQQPDANGLVLFSLCRRPPFTSTNLYSPIQAPNSDAITNDTTFGLVDGTQCYNPQNEQNIVVNPTNNQNVVTSANDYRYGFQAYVYTSTDGGQTFQDVLLPGWSSITGANGVFKKAPAGGDPVLTFAPDGTLYYSALVYTFYSNKTASGLAVASSRDGGLTWSSPALVTFQDSLNYFDDKEWVAAGANGTVYATFTKFSQGAHGAGYLSSNIMLSASRDYGQTWSTPVQVSDAGHPYDQGSSPAVAPDGTLYVAYEGNQAANPAFDQTVVARSTDGGQTFTNSEVGRVFDDYPTCYPLNQSQGRERLSYEQFRLSNYPDLAIDPSTGRLSIVWADDQLNPGCGSSSGSVAGAPAFSGYTNEQVKFVTSSDGQNWTAPHIITSGTYGAFQDKAYPAVAANNGRIVVGFFTRDYSPTPTKKDHTCQRGFLNDSDPGYPASPTVYYIDTVPVCLDYAVESSTNGGASFGPETRVSTQSSNPYEQFAGSFMGDYTGVAVDSNGVAHASWTDDRGLPGITAPNQDTVVGNGF